MSVAFAQTLVHAAAGMLVRDLRDLLVRLVLFVFVLHSNRTHFLHFCTFVL